MRTVLEACIGGATCSNAHVCRWNIKFGRVRFVSFCEGVRMRFRFGNLGETLSDAHSSRFEVALCIVTGGVSGSAESTIVATPATPRRTPSRPESLPGPSAILTCRRGSEWGGMWPWRNADRAPTMTARPRQTVHAAQSPSYTQMSQKK